MRDTLVLATRGSTVAFVVVIFAAMLSSIHSVGTGATDFPLLVPNAARCAFLGLLVPVYYIAVFDARYDAKNWEALLGRMAAKRGTSSEPKRAGRFVLHPWNAHSSHAFTAVGLLVLDARQLDARAPLCTVFLGAALLALGAASYVWWSSGRQTARDIDHTFMEAHLLGNALVALAIAHPPWDTALAAAGCAFTLVRARTLAGADARIISWVLALFACIAYAAHSRGGAGDLRRLAAALLVTFAGLVVKAADALGRRWCWWGTAAFHYTSAASCGLLYFYLQTLPS